MYKKKNNTTSEEKIKQNRRSFLKKAVYSAPSLLVLGSLARPTSALSDSSIAGVPCGQAGYPDCTNN